MPTKVPPTGPDVRDSDDTRESLLSEFAPNASPETLAALRAALDAASAGGGEPAVELDPALDGAIELDPALSGVIEADPSLGAGFDASQVDGEGAEARDGPGAAVEPGLRDALDVAEPVATGALEPISNGALEPTDSAPEPSDDTATNAEKNTPCPTLEPPHALVVQGVVSATAAKRPPPGGEAGAADGARAATSDVPSPVDELLVEESMTENREEHDGVQPTQQEASMAESTIHVEPEDGADPAAACVEEPLESTEAEVDPTPVADDLFEAVPRLARHFMALLEREGTLTMPQVMAHLGLVRPKGVGGAIEPIQRIARLIGVESPFDVDFAPSGHKRWTWRARPLAEVPDEVLESIPAPPPQKPKPKPKPKADRSRYKRAWKRSLAAKKRGKGRGGPKGGRRKGKPSEAVAAGAARAPAVATKAARLPAAHRDESGNVGRAPRGGALVEGRRRRNERPMPEVFRRANRPTPASRPAPARRDERVEDVRPVAERVDVPRLDRPSPAAPVSAAEDGAKRRGVTTPEERLPLPRSGVFRRRTVSDTDVPVVVIRRRKR